MGGLLHLFYSNQGSMARKLLAHKRQGDGLEAPRNSLELHAESFKIFCAEGDIPYSYQVEENLSGKNCYQIKTSMKKLTDEEISDGAKTRKNAPSIVARLMGMDIYPADTKPSIQPAERNTEIMGSEVLKRETGDNGSVSYLHSNSNSEREMELDSFDCNDKRCNEREYNDQKLRTLSRREHPQNEELQKFKKEFQAFQASMFLECSTAVEQGSIPGQLLAQESLNKKKMELYANFRAIASEKNVAPNGPTVKVKSHKRDGLQCWEDKSELELPLQKESLYFRRRMLSGEFEEGHSDLVNFDQKLERSSAPTDIVILKPTPDKSLNHEASFSSSSGTSDKRGSIEEFLEEVKERLKRELQGKNVKKGTLTRGSGIETPFSEKLLDPTKVARRIAKKVREGVNKDLGLNLLLRSESVRSYGSDIPISGSDSPEFIKRDTRRFLSERLRNVLKRESHINVPAVVSGRSGVSLLDDKGKKLKGTRGKPRNEMSHWGSVRDVYRIQARSFRHGPDHGRVLHRESTPSNLIRSLSAPVSGSSFRKLLQEDPHIPTGAQIRRKHENIETVSINAKFGKKDKFSFKEKVSHFRYSFTLRGRLFGRKGESLVRHRDIRSDSVKDARGGPTVIMNFSERHENSTEVPPTPASLCSSTPEDFWMLAESISPASTPDLTSGDDSTLPQAFRDISSNLSELQRKIKQLESGWPEETTLQGSVESQLMPEDGAEAYIRDLLVASGFYDGTCEKSLSRYDPFAKIVSNSVFEKVEESHQNLAKDIKHSEEDINGKMDHKLLLDLLNETLSSVLGPPMTTSGYRRKIITSSTLPTLHGKELLNCVWNVIHAYLYPQRDTYSSLDDTVTEELGFAPWTATIDDETNALGKEIEYVIIRDLIEEIVKDSQ